MDSEFGMLFALWLGIQTAISPCPLATNIVAISYILQVYDGRIPGHYLAGKRIYLSIED